MTYELLPHQAAAVRDVLAHPLYVIADDPGAGKTAVAVESAQALWEQNVIDSVVVVTVAQCRGEWFHPDFGQIRDFLRVPSLVREFHAHPGGWCTHDVVNGARSLTWTVTNYEYLRRHVDELLPRVSERTLLVLDESYAVSNVSAVQHRAVRKLRRKCGRVLMLNGTFYGEDPEDLFGQMTVLDPSILACYSGRGAPSLTVFRARYAVMDPYGFKAERLVWIDGRPHKQRVPVTVARWVNLDDLQRRIAPYVLRRLKADVLPNLPPKLPAVTVPVPLSPESWERYRRMRKDALVWLNEHQLATAAQAGVRVMRLAQLTGGFIGGVEDGYGVRTGEVQDVSSEKIAALAAWTKDRLVAEKGAKILVWARFRRECERVAAALRAVLPGLPVSLLTGGQGPDERTEAIALLNPKTAPTGPAVLVGTPQCGGVGLNLAASHTVVYFSNPPALMARMQSEERPCRPPQDKPVEFYEFLATGPSGQETVDHAVLRGLREKEDVATWTTSAWVRALGDEA